MPNVRQSIFGISAFSRHAEDEWGGRRDFCLTSTLVLDKLRDGEKKQLDTHTQIVNCDKFNFYRVLLLFSASSSSGIVSRRCLRFILSLLPGGIFQGIKCLDKWRKIEENEDPFQSRHLRWISNIWRTDWKYQITMEEEKARKAAHEKSFGSNNKKVKRENLQGSIRKWCFTKFMFIKSSSSSNSRFPSQQLVVG